VRRLRFDQKRIPQFRPNLFWIWSINIDICFVEPAIAVVPAKNSTPQQMAIYSPSGNRNSPHVPKVPKLTVMRTDLFFANGAVVADEPKHANHHRSGVSFAVIDAMMLVNRVNGRIELI